MKFVAVGFIAEVNGMPVMVKVLVSEGMTFIVNIVVVVGFILADNFIILCCSQCQIIHDCEMFNYDMNISIIVIEHCTTVCYIYIYIMYI